MLCPMKLRRKEKLMHTEFVVEWAFKYQIMINNNDGI